MTLDEPLPRWIAPPGCKDVAPHVCPPSGGLSWLVGPVSPAPSLERACVVPVPGTSTPAPARQSRDPALVPGRDRLRYRGDTLRSEGCACGARRLPRRCSGRRSSGVRMVTHPGSLLGGARAWAVRHPERARQRVEARLGRRSVSPCDAVWVEITSLNDAPGYGGDRLVAQPLIEGSQSNVRIIRLSAGQALPPHRHGESDLMLFAVEGAGVLQTVMVRSTSRRVPSRSMRAMRSCASPTTVRPVSRFWRFSLPPSRHARRRDSWWMSASEGSASDA